MTDQDEMEQRLLDDVKEAAERGEGARALPVLIVLASTDGASPPSLQERERRLAKEIDRLSKELARHGRKPSMKPLALSNAIATELTPDEMRRVAADPAVKQLLSNRSERVTTGAKPPGT
jgi:hypothetical protein